MTEVNASFPQEPSSVEVLPGGSYDFEPRPLVRVAEWKVTEAHELPRLWIAYGAEGIRTLLARPTC